MPQIRITADDVERAILPPPRPPGSRPPSAAPVRVGRSTNQLSTISLALALLGIPLIGILLGPLAVLCGCLALSAFAEDDNAWGQRRATIGVCLGFLDFVGWVVFLWWALGAPPPSLAPPATPVLSHTAAVWSAAQHYIPPPRAS